MYGDPFGSGFGMMHNLLPIFFFVTFTLILTTIIIRLGRSAVRFKRDNDSPVLTVECVIVAKRSEVRRIHHAGSNDLTDTACNEYYVTFQVESGDRMELQLSGPEYGLLAEGDRGKLTFQGTRYMGFQRFVSRSGEMGV